MRDLFVITGEIERLKELAVAMERELMRPSDPEDIDYDKLTEMASYAEDVVSNLYSEIIEEDE